VHTAKSEQEHYHVLRDIAKITDSRSGLSEGFTGLNFEPTYIEWVKKIFRQNKAATSIE
jgi:hypothetical protein